jgi:hypothetical protein
MYTGNSFNNLKIDDGINHFVENKKVNLLNCQTTTFCIVTKKWKQAGAELGQAQVELG